LADWFPGYYDTEQRGKLIIIVDGEWVMTLPVSRSLPVIHLETARKITKDLMRGGNVVEI
jgi:hypothetical protein